MIDARNPDYTNTPASDRRSRFGYAPADPDAAPLVSILTPFYKPGPIFRETGVSVFRQSFQQFEWLIVNDATPDPEARALLEEFRRRDPRIRVIDHEANQGLSAARNTGVAAARSDYVVLLDDDDLLEPTAVEKMYWLLETHPEYAAVNGWEVGFGASEYLWPLGFDRGAQILKENCTTGRAMVRCSAHRKIGGHDPAIRGGMEDWEYWLRLADHGMWGYTIPEYLDWYRRREYHHSRWADLDGGPRQQAFCDALRQKYHRLYAGEFPDIRPREHMPFEDLQPERRGVNRLRKDKLRLVMILPQVALGGAERVGLRQVRDLVEAGWEVTVVAVNPGEHAWAPEFARHTPDVFILPRFLRLPDYPAFLSYLIESRAADVVLTCGCELGYLLLPYLRAACPAPAYVDFRHAEAPRSKNGACGRYAAAYQDHVDLTLTTSEHLKDHLVRRGAAAERLEVLGVNVDDEAWRSCPETRTRLLDLLAQAREMHARVPGPRLTARNAWEWATLAIEFVRAHAAAESAEETVANQKARIEELQRGRDWLQGEYEKWRRTAEDAARAWEQREAWARELETAKAWLTDQCGNWQREADRHAARVAELERWTAELTKQIADLTQQIAELTQRIAELAQREVQFNREVAAQAQARQALESELARARRDLQRLRAMCEIWKTQRCYRLLQRAGLLRELVLVTTDDGEAVTT